MEREREREREEYKPKFKTVWRVNTEISFHFIYNSDVHKWWLLLKYKCKKMLRKSKITISREY